MHRLRLPLILGLTLLLPTSFAAPPNDLCANAIELLDGDTPFTNVDAGYDGPSTCSASMRDVWFVYHAQLSGTLVVETCGLTNVDTVLVAYSGAACPPGLALACSDDSCAPSASLIAFAVTAGQSYLVQLSGFGGDQGTGQLRAGLLGVESITYQGRVSLDGVPVDGSADFIFDIYDSSSGGNSLGSIPRNNVTVNDGLFTVALPVPSALFTDHSRYLEISVRAPAGAGAFTALTPRQAITPAPTALHATRAGEVEWSAIANLPFGFTDNEDDVGVATVTAGAGLSGGGIGDVTLSTIFFGTGSANSSARSDHTHSFLSGPGGAPGNVLRVDSMGRVGLNRNPTSNQLEVNGSASKTSAGDWLANSDARIKTDVRTIENALDVLDRVRLVEFRYTADYRAQYPSIEDRLYLNVIAQEFAQVFPEHVKPSGEKLPDGGEILQVDTWPLTIYSARAIQELRLISNAQANRLAAVERENADLRERLEKLEALLAK